MTKIFWVLLLIFGADHLLADQATADLSADDLAKHLAAWKKKREEVKKILEDLDSKRQKIYTDCDQRVQLIQKQSNLLKKKQKQISIEKITI